MIGRAKDSSRLSTEPAQIRRRLRRKHEHFQEDLELYKKHAGYKPVEEWDLEELAHGRPRNKAGDFRSRAPGWMTVEIAKEARRRLLDQAFGGLASHLNAALKVVKELMESEEVDDKGRPLVDAATKLKAAMFIIEHVIGKPTSVVQVDGLDMTRQILASAIVLDDGNPQDEIVVLDGEFTEEDDDDT